MQNIIFHSDDYGINLPSSQYILDCHEQGALNRLAILANSPNFSSCCELLTPYVRSGSIDISVHLNLVEGKSLSKADQLSILTDQDGYFCCSFESLLMKSLSSQRRQLRQEIKNELSLQIQRVQDAFPDALIGLDSHQHFHMIPLVFEVVLEIVGEKSMDVPYIRVSGEPLMPFITTPSIWCYIKPINVIKNMLLNFFSLYNDPKLRSMGISTNIFWGLMFSGDMNLHIVSKLMTKFQAIAQRRGLPLEVLSHPCPIPRAEDCLDPRKKDFVAFYTSKGREDEAIMLKNISSVFHAR